MSENTKVALYKALRSAIYSLTPEERKDRYMTPAEVGVLFSVSAKTVERARLAQAKALNATPPARLDDLGLESLVFVAATTGSERNVINQESIHVLFQRRAAASKTLEERITASMGINAVLAFHDWTSEAAPTDTWPFSIQPDGRPLEFCAALLSDKLTGDVEWLTLREFSDKLATAAANAFAHAEAKALDEAALDGNDG